MASAVSGTVSATVRLWKATLTRASMAFEQVERLGAGAAAPLGLAGRRPEAADLLGIRGAALRAGDAALARGVGRRDAIVAQLPLALLADPGRGPGRRQHGVDPDV